MLSWKFFIMENTQKKKTQKKQDLRTRKKNNAQKY